jgi:hypothetical protein
VCDVEWLDGELSGDKVGEKLAQAPREYLSV